MAGLLVNCAGERVHTYGSTPAPAHTDVSVRIYGRMRAHMGTCAHAHALVINDIGLNERTDQLTPFSDAFWHLYNMVCPSKCRILQLIGHSVIPSIPQSIHTSFRPSVCGLGNLSKEWKN